MGFTVAAAASHSSPSASGAQVSSDRASRGADTAADPAVTSKHTAAVAALRVDPSEPAVYSELQEPYLNKQIASSASQYGWFESEEHVDEEGAMVRDAWLQVVRGDSSDFELVTPDNCYDVLFLWENTRPLVANRFLSNDHIDSLATGMSVSGCVSGFRLVNQGVIHAQFCVIFSYGSHSYKSWKRYSDFEELYNVVHYLHKHTARIFPRTLAAWEMLIRHRKVFRCVEVKYLIKKSIYLGKFVEALIFEAPSPGLMLHFIRSALWNNPDPICELLTT